MNRISNPKLIHFFKLLNSPWNFPILVFIVIAVVYFQSRSAVFKESEALIGALFGENHQGDIRLVRYEQGLIAHAFTTDVRLLTAKTPAQNLVESWSPVCQTEDVRMCIGTPYIKPYTKDCHFTEPPQDMEYGTIKIPNNPYIRGEASSNSKHTHYCIFVFTKD